MHFTADQARHWTSIFPRHPLVWLVAAALIAAIMVRRPPPDASSAGIPTASSHAANNRAERCTRYGWLSKRSQKAYRPLAERIATPDGFQRIALRENSFADWLRHLPALPANAAVVDGRGKPARPADDPQVAAVIDLPPTNRGLLGAANMAIRLRAEYLWSAQRMDDLHLSFTSGEPCPWAHFGAGERPTVQGKVVTWHKPRIESKPGSSRTLFTAYLECLLPYTSIISLEHDTEPVMQGDVEPGDLFVLNGRNGHAIVVLDAVTNAAGERRVLLGEGFTPPQSFHVIKQSDGSAWFKLDRAAPITVPTWPAPFPWRTWRRWPQQIDNR